MESIEIVLVKYEASPGKVFDWKNLEEHKLADDTGYAHVYANTLFIGPYDSIDNYEEVDAPTE